MMTSTSLSSISSLPRLKLSSTRKVRTNQRPRFTIATRRDAHDQHYGYVDENLIVLRKRIHEMKMIERNYEPPSDWMDWEKRYYASYDTFICDAMGFLQSQLMNTRPSYAIAMFALITLSVPTSTLFMFSNLINISAGIHF